MQLCRLHTEKQGWTVVDSYTDRAISGASLLRPGIQELIGEAMCRKFGIVLGEAMDLRLIAGILGEANHVFVFTHRPFVERYLEKARQVGPDILKEAIGALFGSAVSGVRTERQENRWPVTSP